MNLNKQIKKDRLTFNLQWERFLKEQLFRFHMFFVFPLYTLYVVGVLLKWWEDYTITRCSLATFFVFFILFIILLFCYFKRHWNESDKKNLSHNIFQMYFIIIAVMNIMLVGSWLAKKPNLIENTFPKIFLVKAYFFSFAALAIVSYTDSLAKDSLRIGFIRVNTKIITSIITALVFLLLK